MSREHWSVSPAQVALGDLTAEQQAQAERLLDADARFRAEVQRLRRATTVLQETPAEIWRPHSVPALDVERAEAARPAPDRRRARGIGHAWLPRPVLAGAAAVLLLAVGVGAGLALAPSDSGSPAARVASMTVPLTPLPGTESPGERASVRMPVRAGGEARLTVRGLKPSSAGDYYELWLMTDDAKLASIGTFRVGPDGRADVRFPVGVNPRGYRYVDVSREPDDGRPGHSALSVLRSAQLS